MQTEDTSSGQLLLSQPNPDGYPTANWAPDQQPANWAPMNSSNGYGRPDPDEFGLAPLDPLPPDVGMIPDLIPFRADDQLI